MDRELSKSEQSKTTLKKIAYACLIIGLLVGAFYGFQKFVKKTGDVSEFLIVPVERGNIKNTLSASGTIVASSERIINAPISTEIESVHLTTGAQVNKGDLILELDKEYTSLEYERLDDELSLRKNSIEKLRLQYDKDLRDIDYQDQIKALQLDELNAQVLDQERLLKIGGATAEDVESAKLKLKIAEIEKKVLENELQFKRSVNTTDKKNLQLEYNIQTKRLKELGKKLRETKVKAPAQGVITWINEDIGKTVVEGEPLVRIANLDRYEVEAVTSDRNAKTLQVGLQVEVRINKDKLSGTISRILPAIEDNTVKFFIQLDENDHKLLRPSLRTEVYVITEEKENVLRAKRGSALKGTKSQYIYKVENNQARKVRITKGLISGDYFEIEDGLTEGDRIIVSETKLFDHMEEFEIKKKEQ